jgi:hypothetical protein
VEAGEPRSSVSDGSGTATASQSSSAPVTAKPINAVPLFFQVLWSGIRRLFGAKA